jgi:hypothetical protein
MQCTWVEPKTGRCHNLATLPQIAKDGERWANLCNAHDAELSLSVDSLDVRMMLSSWVRAGGGPKKMAART